MKVLQISDTHLGARVAGFNANFDRIADWVRAEAPDLVIHTGDITRDAPGAPEELAFAKARLDQLGAPWLAIPGNHDIGDNPSDGYMPKKPVDGALLQAYRDVFGPDRWVETRGGWRLIGVNSLLMGSGLDEEAAQWDWLEAALTGDAPTALFLHKPIVLTEEATPEDPPYRYLPREPRARMIDLIAKGGVKMVGCGHVHQTRDHMLGGARCVWAPATAFCLPDDLQPRIGEKICGAVRHMFSPDGAHNFEIARPVGVADQLITEFPEAYR